MKGACYSLLVAGLCMTPYVWAHEQSGNVYLSLEPLYERVALSESPGVLTNMVPGGPVGASSSGTLANVNVGHVHSFGASGTIGYVFPSGWRPLGTDKTRLEIFGGHIKGDGSSSATEAHATPGVGMLLFVDGTATPYAGNTFTIARRTDVRYNRDHLGLRLLVDYRRGRYTATPTLAVYATRSNTSYRDREDYDFAVVQAVSERQASVVKKQHGVEVGGQISRTVNSYAVVNLGFTVGVARSEATLHGSQCASQPAVPDEPCGPNPFLFRTATRDLTERETAATAQFEFGGSVEMRKLRIGARVGARYMSSEPRISFPTAPGESLKVNFRSAFTPFAQVVVTGSF